MKLLVIGGGRFVGHHVVEAACARGDEVTVFNRGMTRDTWPAGVRVLIGDRRGDLTPLARGSWDAVVDTCGYLPAEVARMAAALSGRFGRYVFISTISVYADFRQPVDESAPLARIDDADTSVVDGRTYGPLKALCEAALRRELGGRDLQRALCLRPGLIVGPGDPTDRFTYWPLRLARSVDGGPVLAPGRPQEPVQCIDARDLAAFVLHAIGQELRGAFNVASPAGRWTFGELLHTCAAEAGAGAVPLVWAASERLEALGVQPWLDLPLWLPAQGEHAAFMQVNCEAAQRAGLQVRPLAETVHDTLAWHRSLPGEQQASLRVGISAEREAELLAALAG
jgi:2'-hydroxyisoflavone reductase